MELKKRDRLNAQGVEIMDLNQTLKDIKAFAAGETACVLSAY